MALTEEHSAMTAPRRPPRRTWTLGRALAGLSGALTAGMVLLTIVVGAAALLQRAGDAAGPGTATVVAHVLATALCLVLQRFADRYTGRTRTLCALGVLVAVAVVLVLYWWF